MSIHSGLAASKWWLDQLLRTTADGLGRQSKMFWRLIRCVRQWSTLLPATNDWGATSREQAARVISCCAELIDHQYGWHPDRRGRAPELWRPPAGSARAQLASLVQHLIDRYPVPDFLTDVWWSDGQEAWPRLLYLHLARGYCVRSFAFPFEFSITKPILRWFAQAPRGLSAFAALRWAQIRALGGEDQLARRILEIDFLREPTIAENFWETVFRFLIRNTPISDIEVQQILRFIDRQRFWPGDLVWGAEASEDPLQPDFTLRGRSLMSLRRHMANWREEVRPKLRQSETTSDWRPTDIQPFEFVKDDDLWTIKELLTGRALKIEGANMRHCVGSYVDVCVKRESSIWSMRVQQGEQRRRVLTIEVLPESRRVYQASGKCNSEPTPIALEMLNRWAERERLTVDESL